MVICSVKHGAIDSNLHYTGQELILPTTHPVYTCTYFSASCAILSALYFHCCAETLGCILHSYFTPVPILPSVMAYKHCSADIFSLQHFTLISIIQHFRPLTNLSYTQNHVFVLISFPPKNQNVVKREPHPVSVHTSYNFTQVQLW